MEQRTPRLGDVVDDYCPRERRITNHAIVAIVEDAIRQTRCTTCEAEHVFKQGRAPLRRRKEPETLYEQVLANVTGSPLMAPRAEPFSEDVNPGASPAGPPPASATAPPPSDTEDTAAAPADGAHAHRRLIRAALPKIEGELPPPRPIPEFTMHQRPPQRAGRSRFSRGQPNDTGGFRDGRSGRSFQGNGSGNGNASGNGNGPAPRGHGGGGNAAGRSGRRRGPGQRGGR